MANMNLDEQNKRRLVVLIEWFEKLGIGSMYLCSVYGWAQIVCKVLHESGGLHVFYFSWLLDPVIYLKPRTTRILDGRNCQKYLHQT